MLANRGMDEGDVPRIYNGALLMHKKEQNCFIFRDMDRLRDPHTEGGESERVEQIPYLCMYVLSLQLCPTLCDPMDCSPPGSSVHGILQLRTQEWIAMSSSRGSSQPGDQTHTSHISCIGRQVLYRECHLGSLGNNNL